MINSSFTWVKNTGPESYINRLARVDHDIAPKANCRLENKANLPHDTCSLLGDRPELNKMLATQTAIRNIPSGNNTTSALKSLKAIHQIISQYLNKNNVQPDGRNISPDCDNEMEALSILTEVKHVLASSGLQDGAVTPPDSVTSQPGTPPPSANKRNISLTLQPSAIHSHSPTQPAGKPAGGSGARPPQEAIMGLFAQMSATSAINLFKHWGVFDAIPIPSQEIDGPGPVGISFADLARRVNVEEALLSKFHFPQPHFQLQS